ncbi:MAG: phosphatidyl-myo-inositol alpha-mannosyltransferase [Solirubrobacteraceae bacterium]|nr:phosphatidyl-myo-inositol alpha-mannosyltransferase [Solirubrobacteraceae bacterium]
MRILAVSHYALPHLGGIEVVVDGLARELVARGHEVVHVASSATAGAPGRAPGGYRVERVPALNVLERIDVPYPLFAPSLVGVLRREIARADVVHAHGLLYQSAAAAIALAARSARRPARVVTEHVGHVAYAAPLLDRAQALALATLGRATARRAQALVTLNDAVDAGLAALAPATRRVRIHNGVDAERYRPAPPGERAALRRELGWDDGVPRVLFVGRLVAKKGLDAALAATAEGAGAFRLVVVGPGTPPRAPGANVHVLGAMPPDRVAALYRAADAFLLPSRGEGFPLTAQEAMASGLPVVLADEPAYAEYLGGAGAGARTAAADGAALARAVAGALADPAAGAAAAAHARQAFSWAAAAVRHEALYRELLAGDARDGR